ncbi:MAG: hypothetical protein QNJ40_05405 [Xanthomonadales bacterium]|nr:hypothetical protein [Xanthomonadales bacterium]
MIRAHTQKDREPWWFAISLLVLSLLSWGALARQEPAGDTSILPRWHGVWTGSLQNLPLRPDPPQVEVILEVGVGDDADDDCLIWRSTYSEGGEQRQVKDYRLCRKDDGRFVLDEQNGIVLELSVFGDVIYSAFQYGERTLVVRHAIDGRSMTEEIFFAHPERDALDQVQPLTGRGLQLIRFVKTKESVD